VILRGVSTARKKGRRRPSRPSRGPQNALGGLLADLRAARRLSLREVEDATNQKVSNAYLSQLETGKIRKPSPLVFNRLAEVYAVPYELLMEKAGYLPPSDEGTRRKRPGSFAIDDLTADEEGELLHYLAFIRSRDPAP